MPRGNPNFGKKSVPVGDIVVATTLPPMGTASIESTGIPVPSIFDNTSPLAPTPPVEPVVAPVPAPVPTEPEFVTRGIVNVITFPDQKCLMGTQSIIQDALVYIGYNEDGEKIEKKKDLIFSVQDISKNGVWQLRIDSERGATTQEFMNPIIAKQFAQGQGFLLGKQEQQRREFDKMGI